jgi:amino acid transporter
MTDAYEHVHDQVEEIAHDWTTFETLDEDELVAQAEEAGTYQLDPLNDDQDVADEMLDNFIHPPDPMDPFTSQHKLGVLPLAVIVFYNVSGGPFGVETSVRAGGNFYALLGFLVMPFVWSLQEALMTAELGTAFPEASGGVAWVEEAFGPSAGWMSGYLGWIAGATDNAIYPVLFLDYLLQSTHTDIDQISPIIRFCFLSITSVLLGYVNWRGLPLVGKMSVWICLLAMSPFIILILVGSSQVDTNRWFEFPNNSDFDTAEEATDDDASGGFFPNAVLGGVLWRPFLNNLFWNLNSFDAAGSFAGEIENSSQLFPRAMFLSVVLVASCYFFPLLIAIGATDAERQDWTDGFLAHVAGEVGGPWLGAWTVFAAAISNIALFQAELSADAFQLMGMADRGHLPKIFSKRSKHGTPTNGIILGIAVIVVMGVSNFEQLIEMLNFNYALSLLMEYCAFLKLRISRPELERPYRIPLNTVGCMLLFTPGILVTLLLLSLATYATFIFVICINIVGMLVFCAKQHSKEMAQKETSSYEKIIDASVETSVDTDETSGLDGNRS